MREASIPPASRDGAGLAEAAGNGATVTPPNRVGEPNLASAAAAAGAAIAAGAGATALAGFPGAKSRAQSRITLTPRDSHLAYTSWDAPEDHKADVRAQGGNTFKLRLYDVTGQNVNTYNPTQFDEFDVSEQDWDRNLPIPAADRDYVTEIGYTTADGRWLPLARSNSIRIADPGVAEGAASTGDALPGAGIAAGAAIAAGAGAAALSSLKGDPQSNVGASKFDVGQTDLTSESLASVDEGLPELPDGYDESRIVLMPRDPQWAYSYWDTRTSTRQNCAVRAGKNWHCEFTT